MSKKTHRAFIYCKLRDYLVCFQLLKTIVLVNVCQFVFLTSDTNLFRMVKNNGSFA